MSTVDVFNEMKLNYPEIEETKCVMDGTERKGNFWIGKNWSNCVYIFHLRFLIFNSHIFAAIFCNFVYALVPASSHLSYDIPTHSKRTR